MKVAEALNARSTVRAFRSDPVAKETIEHIIKAAIRTPSWANSQPWEIYVAGNESLERIRKKWQERVKSDTPRKPEIPVPTHWPAVMQKRREELTSNFRPAAVAREDEKSAMKIVSDLNNRFFGAPVVLYLCMDRTLTQWSMFDLGAMSQSIMLAAQEYGVDSAVAIMLAAYPDLIRTELGIPDDLAIVIGVALGYRDAQNPVNKFRSPRRPLEDVVHLKGL